MKKRYFILSCMIALCLAFLSGCGGQGESTAGSDTEKVYSDILAEREPLTMPSEQDKDWQCFSMQFYQGEPVQFWGKKKTDDKESVSWDVYLYQADGSSRLLLENAPREYYAIWYMDKEGNCYVIQKGIARLDKDGTELWHWTGGIVRDICQLSDGRIMLILNIEEKNKLAELNPSSGEVSIKENITLNEDGEQYIGAGENGLVMMNQEGFWEINMESGSSLCVMPFEGTSYSFGMVSDFRTTEDGRIAIIQNGELETLQLVNILENKTIITVRNSGFGSVWTKTWAEEFNRQNEKYYVVLEERDDSTSVADFRTQTGVELATGKGPDIVGGDALTDINSLIAKGGLVNLAPYMLESGIREEDYFPCTFNCFRDGEAVYTVSLNISLSGGGFWIKEDVLGDCEELDIESFVNALYDYQEKAVLRTYWYPEQVLQYAFLVGTEDLWGMVDWEKGTCDFSGELFAKMLEVAKRYGYSEERKDYPALAAYRRDRNCYDRESFAQLEGEGKRYVGYLADDGSHTMMLSCDVLAINNNSPNKEGAWEFISFMLGQEAQSDFRYRQKNDSIASSYPVYRAAFSEVMEAEMEEGSIGQKIGPNGGLIPDYKAGQKQYLELNLNEEAYRELYDLTEETVREIEGILEDVRPRPARTLEIQSIIYEEAEAYFNGTKSIEEVVKIIENRVQLYLQENG